ncbi:MAG: TetR/AcrR family transcriptional regulator [Gemmatimonadota bacterium]
MPKRSPDWLAETYERLLDAAWWLAEDRGYSGFTTRDVCEAAMLSMGALYQHFPGKRELVRSCIEAHASQQLHRYVWGRTEADADPLEQLEVVLRGHVAIYGGQWGAQHCALDVASWGEWLRDPEVGAPVVAEVGFLLGLLYQMIREGQRTGRVERHLFAPAAAEALAGTLLGLVLLRRFGWRYSPRRMGDAVALLVRGLEARGTGRGLEAGGAVGGGGRGDRSGR